MIRILFLFALASSLISFQARAEGEFPRLAMKIGYPFVHIQDNAPTYGADFGAINFGAVLTFKFNPFQELNIHSETSWTPKRRFFSLERKNSEAEGDTSLTTSFYSLVYSHTVGTYNNRFIKLSLGPSIGIYTVNFFDLFKKELEINEINRVRVINAGVRFGVVYEDFDESFYEFALIYSKENEYTLISDSTNDAEIIERFKGIEDSPVWIASFNFGKYIF